MVLRVMDMNLFANFWTKKPKFYLFKISIFLVTFLLLLTSCITIPEMPENTSYMGSTDPQENSLIPSEASRGAPRSPRSLSFTEISSGLPSSEYFNYIASGDFNNDGDIDLVFTAETTSSNSAGVYAYTGNGGISWTNTSTGLIRQYAWAGVALCDADEDGYEEIYATDEGWGISGNLGVKVWEYRNNQWNDSATHVSTPLSTGTPYNVFLTNITGDNKSDIVICNNNGIKYFQNNGGNPVTWQERSNGLNSTRQFTALAVADMNKDGLMDIIACDYSDGEHLFIQNTTAPLWRYYGDTFYIPGNCLGLAVGDVNNDTHMDMVFGKHSSGSGIRCLLGNSGGAGGTSFVWTPADNNLPSNYRCYGVKLADIDLDWDLDIVAACSSGNRGMKIYLGNGSTYPGTNMGWTEALNTNLTSTGDWYTTDCPDINGDGSHDIVAVSWGSGVKAWLNNLSADVTPPGFVNDLICTNVTTNSISVNWTAPCDNGTNASTGPVKGYDIRYSTGNINPGNWASATECIGEPVPANPSTQETFKITGLSTNTTYYIALRSRDERPNWSPLSNVVFNTTLPIIDFIRPGQIKDLQTTTPTNNSLNLTWTAPANNGTNLSSGPVVEYDIRYNLSGLITNLTWDGSTEVPVSLTPNLPGLTENYNVTGLQADTTYYFAIKARDERPNWGWISNSPSGTTLDGTPPESIIDLLAIEPTDTSINLTWTAPGDDGNSGTASQYDIRYATTSITGLTWSTAIQCENEPIPQNVGNIEYYNVTGLDPDTTYYFAIKTADEIPLWSGLSNIAFNTTLPSIDTIPPATITDLTASQPTPTNITLRWSAPGDDGNSGICSGYDIRYSIEPVTESIWTILTQCPNPPSPVTPGNQQTYIVSGLLSSQKYYFAVKAFDERPNYSPLSNIANATTLSSNDEVAPNAVTDLSAGTLSSNSIELTWTAPGDDGGSGTVTGYDIRYSTSSITESNWEAASKCDNEPLPQIAGSSESFTVAGLFSSTMYYFALKSFDERPNYSLLSNIASATTYSSDDAILPDRITDLTVLETTETTATLTWTAPGDDGNSGTATAYDIRYAEFAITTGNWDSSIGVLETPTPKSAGQNEIYLVTGLDESITYYFAIKAADEVPNWSPVSNSPLGTTLGTAKPELAVTFTPDEITLESEQSIDLEISVKSKIELQVISDASIELSSNNPELVLSPDNGQTDQTGVLIIGITAPIVDDLTQIILYVNVSKLGFRTNRSQLIITVQPQLIPPIDQFNLHITSNDLTLSQSIIEAGDVITIYANITNIGTRDATVFTVRFFINDQQNGFDQQITSLKINDYYRAELLWTTIEGNHTIRVEVVANEPELESDLTDNSAMITITVLDKDDGEDDRGKSDDKTMGIENYAWILIIIIVIIIVLILFILLMKRKKPMEEAPAPSYERVIDQEQVQEPTESIGPEQLEEPTPSPIQEDLVTEQEIPSEEPGVTPETEATPMLGMEEQPPAQPVETPPHKLAQEVPVEEPGQEQLQEPTGEEQPTQEQTVAEVKQFPCPICQNKIPLNTSPCPQCGTELNW